MLALRLGVWLGLALAILKMLVLLRSEQADWGIGLDSAGNLPLAILRVSFKDFFLGICVGLVGWAICQALKRWPNAVRRAYRTQFVICALFCLYGAVSVGVFEYFGRPLTFDLFRFMHGVAAARSSLGERLTLPIVCIIFGGPMAFAAVAAWDSYRPALPTWVITAFAAVWIGIGSFQARSTSEDWKSSRQVARSLALNPHVALASSTFHGLLARKPALPSHFSPEQTREFSTFGARGEVQTPFQLPGGVKRPRNVIVVTLESVGTKYLSLYGSPYPTTPCLNAEAANAAVFENIYAHASQTICSFRSINFSVYPGLPWTLMGWSERKMPAPLADFVGHRGSRTAYFHNGTLEWGGERWMLDERYDTVEDYTEWNCPALTSWGAEDRYTIERLIKFIDEEPAKPFLAYCWTDQTHDPYLPSEGMQMVDFFAGRAPPLRYRKDLLHYLNVVHEVDHQLGRLFQALRERNLADDTLVVITGDHGEAFADPHLQRGHGLTVFEEELRVPLMFWNPRLFPNGKRLPTLGGHVDLNPTIASLLGIDPLSEWQGHSLFDPGHPPRAFFMANISSDYLFGVREDSWKYTLNATTGEETLFDLLTDPAEQQSVAGKEPEQCRKLRERVMAWVWFENAFLEGKAN